MTTVAGQTNKQHATERIHRAYRDRLLEMADTFGFEREYLAMWFEQFTLMRQREQSMERNLAAFCAWQDLEGFFMKQGSEPN